MSLADVQLTDQGGKKNLPLVLADNGGGGDHGLGDGARAVGDGDLGGRGDGVGLVTVDDLGGLRAVGNVAGDDLGGDSAVVAVGESAGGGSQESSSDGVLHLDGIR